MKILLRILVGAAVLVLLVAVAIGVLVAVGKRRQPFAPVGSRPAVRKEGSVAAFRDAPAAPPFAEAAGAPLNPAPAALQPPVDIPPAAEAAEVEAPASEPLPAEASPASSPSPEPVTEFRSSTAFEAEDGPAEELDTDASAADVVAPVNPAAEAVPKPPVAADAASAATPTETQRRADDLLDEGNAFFNVAQYQLAIEKYDDALKIAPDLVAAYYNRANARTRTGDYDGALDDYNRALELHPDDADSLNNRGMLHLYTGRHDEALADFDRAVVVSPSDTTVVVNRGLAYLHRGDLDKSLVDFKEAARIDPYDPAAHYGCAQACAQLGDADAALESLAKAVRIDAAYAREAAADPRFTSLHRNDGFTRLLREHVR